MVDIEYIVEEKFVDQIEFLGGYGNKMIIGIFGFIFSNFLMWNVMKKGVWFLFLGGDGQCLLFCVQING